MENRKTDLLVKKIRNKAKLILKDCKHANLILDLLKYSQHKSNEIACISIQCLGDVFSYFISTQQYLDPGKTTLAEKDLSKENQFSYWLREQFSTTTAILSDHLSHESSDVQKYTLEAMVKLLRAEGEQKSNAAKGKLIEIIVAHLLSKDRDQAQLIQQFHVDHEENESNSDTILLCLMLTRRKIKSAENIELPSDVFMYNCWRMIQQVASHDLDTQSRRLLTGVVCDFLINKIPTGLYREILTGISTVMDKMSTPLRLTDFLSESFNIGGAVSLMSLHGLFILMHKYNLDYPDFYAKLYSMFEPQIFSAKYRARFFHLANTFLSSTHLPSYLVAAFAKRLARLCLHAPASAAHICVPFIFNLVARHPALEVMLGVGRTDGTKEFETDPFLSEEVNLAKCKAIESCLWELETLGYHYDPSLSQKSKKRKKPEQDLSTLLESTTTDIMATYAKKVKKGTIPLNFVRISGLYLPDPALFSTVLTKSSHCGWTQKELVWGALLKFEAIVLKSWKSLPQSLRDIENDKKSIKNHLMTFFFK
ncbi:unnamed protein product [Lymnaea stagnalis]|uniref:CCAAT-binding factor domain-containing protein n=1 Tax=Lymnaea stagnalis TaxID=6523 RepID=A0AAV2HPV4_LYMST